MDIVIAGEETRWSPNHDAGRPTPPTLIVIHSTRGKALTPMSEYEATVNYCARPNAHSNTCPHYVVGPTACCRMVHDADTAWHARYLNPRSLGIEVAQSYHSTPFTETEYALTAKIVARWCHELDIPPVHVDDEDLPGFLGHDETAQGRGEKKSDPGYRWDWTYFGVLVARELVHLAPSPSLDPWAGVGSGLAAVGKAHPEWGTPNPRAESAHYWDGDHDEVVKLSTGDWLVWRDYTGQWKRIHWD